MSVRADSSNARICDPTQSHPELTVFVVNLIDSVLKQNSISRETRAALISALPRSEKLRRRARLFTSVHFANQRPSTSSFHYPVHLISAEVAVTGKRAADTLISRRYSPYPRRRRRTPRARRKKMAGSPLINNRTQRSRSVGGMKEREKTKGERKRKRERNRERERDGK